MQLLKEYEQREPVCRVELKQIKKIDANFFKIDVQKWLYFLYLNRKYESIRTMRIWTRMPDLSYSVKRMFFNSYY